MEIVPVGAAEVGLVGGSAAASMVESLVTAQKYQRNLRSCTALRGLHAVHLNVEINGSKSPSTRTTC